MSTAEDVIGIAEKLETIISTRVAQRVQNQTMSIEKFSSLKYTLENELERAQQFYDQCKGQGLSVAMIDAEGYLRAMRDVANLVKETESWFPDA